jgi:hypothetical protein
LASSPCRRNEPAQFREADARLQEQIRETGHHLNIVIEMFEKHLRETTGRGREQLETARGGRRIWRYRRDFTASGMIGMRRGSSGSIP